MPALTEPPGTGLAGNAFAFGTQNLQDQFPEQSWAPDQLQRGQLEWDDILPEDLECFSSNVDFSSISASPEAVRLLRNLHVDAQSESKATVAPRLKKRMSVLEFPPLKIGKMLRPLSPDDDLLGEMLEDK